MYFYRAEGEDYTRGLFVVSVSVSVFQTLSPPKVMDGFQQIMAQNKADNILYRKTKSFFQN
jgi:hypothetical protein